MPGLADLLPGDDGDDSEDDGAGRGAQDSLTKTSTSPRRGVIRTVTSLTSELGLKRKNLYRRYVTGSPWLPRSRFMTSAFCGTPSTSVVVGPLLVEASTLKAPNWPVESCTAM